GMQVLQTPHSF
nr:immunoglobulin light chain junction region [Macaca mulatta]